jgi:hypothetical protein
MCHRRFSPHAQLVSTSQVASAALTVCLHHVLLVTTPRYSAKLPYVLSCMPEPSAGMSMDDIVDCTHGLDQSTPSTGLGFGQNSIFRMSLNIWNNVCFGVHSHRAPRSLAFVPVVSTHLFATYP